MNNPICLTVDYECDWGGRIKKTYGIEKKIYKLLEILSLNDSKATFFISTETVGNTKNIIKDIAENGHEIASHGHNHFFHYDALSKNELEYEISYSKKILEEITGKEVLGFRTPYFKKNIYTDDLLLKYDYKYDSSAVQTSLHGRYKENQYNTNTDIKHFNVSTIKNKFPAGLKWINIFGKEIVSPDTTKIIYLHLFDMLTIKETLSLIEPNISLKYILFYMARRENMFSTLKAFPEKFIPLSELL